MLLQGWTCCKSRDAHSKAGPDSDLMLAPGRRFAMCIFSFSIDGLGFLVTQPVVFSTLIGCIDMPRYRQKCLVERLDSSCHFKSRLGMGGEMSKVIDTQDLVGDQDLIVDSRAKAVDKKAEAEAERHGADELLSNMKGVNPTSPDFSPVYDRHCFIYLLFYFHAHRGLCLYHTLEFEDICIDC